MESLKQVVPEFTASTRITTSCYGISVATMATYNLVGIMQKFIDQSISANTNYDPSKYEPGGKVPMKLLLRDLLNRV